METKQEPKTAKINSKDVSTTPIRVKRETRKKILQELVKANKKDFGRNLRADELIALAVTLLQPEHIRQLQEGTLSNGDRLERQFKGFVAKHGTMSKDAFLGKLLAGEIGEAREVQSPSLKGF